MKRLLILTTFLISFSCSKTNKDNLVGKYSLNSSCSVTIEISKINGEYYYELKGKQINKKGKLKIKIDQKERYLIFDDLSGLLKTDNLIILQNYGNSMNQYLNIPDCDEKYLEFIKAPI